MKKILNTILIGILLLPMIAKAEVYIEDFDFIGYGIDFDKDKTSYDLTVENSVTRFGGIIQDADLHWNEIGDKFDNLIKPNYLVISPKLRIHGDITDLSKKEQIVACGIYAEKSYIKLNGEKLNVEFYNQKKETPYYPFINDNSIIEYYNTLVDYARSDALDCKNEDNEDDDGYTETCKYNGEIVSQEVKSGDNFTKKVYKNGNLVYFDIINLDIEGVYEIQLHGNLKVGLNTLEIVLADDDGEKTYTFNITRKPNEGKTNQDKPSQEDKDELPPPTGNATYVVAIIMLVLSFGVGIYAYYKKSLDIK